MPNLRVTLEGYPEKVQRIADVIEVSFPSVLAWVQADCRSDIAIKIEGYEIPVQMQISGLVGA